MVYNQHDQSGSCCLTTKKVVCAFYQIKPCHIITSSISILSQNHSKNCTLSCRQITFDN